QIAASIGSIIEHADSIRQEIRAAIQKLAEAAGKISTTLSVPLGTWKARLDNASSEVEKLRHDNPTGAVATTLQSLREELKGFRADFSVADSVVARVEQLAGFIQSPPGDRDFAALIADQGGIFSLLGDLEADLPRLQSVLVNWRPRAD